MKISHFANLLLPALLLLGAMLLLVACSKSEAVEKRSDATTAKVSADEVAQDEDALAIFEPELISAFVIDDDDFRVNGLRIGLQDFVAAENPHLNYFMPKHADYIDILRCQTDATIVGNFAGIENVELHAMSQAAQEKLMRSNDFWQAAAASAGCKLIGTNVSNREGFLDISAPSGSYVYMARACVDKQRLKDVELAKINRNCSRQISMSNPLNEFTNRRAAAELKAVTQASDEAAKIDALGREIYFLSVQLNNALVNCQKQEEARRKASNFKESLGQVLGYGIAIGGFFTKAAMNGKTFKEAFSELWNDDKGVRSSGKSLAGALNELFSEGSDYPKVCSSAVRIAEESKICKWELQAAHSDYADAMDIATALAKQRSDFESAK
jgi:hypothetical protein